MQQREGTSHNGTLGTVQKRPACQPSSYFILTVSAYKTSLSMDVLNWSGRLCLQTPWQAYVREATEEGFISDFFVTDPAMSCALIILQALQARHLLTRQKCLSGLLGRWHLAHVLLFENHLRRSVFCNEIKNVPRLLDIHHAKQAPEDHIINLVMFVRDTCMLSPIRGCNASPVIEKKWFLGQE